MAREDPHFRLRLPAALRDSIAETAKANGRSMNAEIVDRLTKRSGAGEPSTDLPAIYMLIDAEGVPTCWTEVMKHIEAVNKAGEFHAVSLSVNVFTPEFVSSSARENEAKKLVDWYRDLFRKKAKAER